MSDLRPLLRLLDLLRSRLLERLRSRLRDRLFNTQAILCTRMGEMLCVCVCVCECEKMGPLSLAVSGARSPPLSAAWSFSAAPLTCALLFLHTLRVGRAAFRATARASSRRRALPVMSVINTLLFVTTFLTHTTNSFITLKNWISCEYSVSQTVTSHVHSWLASSRLCR